MARITSLGLVFIFLIVAGYLFVGAVDQGFEDEVTKTNTTDFNETFTPDGDVTLSVSDPANSFPTSIEVGNGSVIYAESGNYTWNDYNGTITVVNNSELDNQSVAYAKFDYWKANEAQKITYGPLTTLLITIGPFALLVGLIMALHTAGMFAGRGL